jgi:epoxyqueuosine reductase QueG
VASCAVDAYDARAPSPLRSAALLTGTRGVVVAGSGGPALWRSFRAHMRERRELWDQAHPYDAFVADVLGHADRALDNAGVRFRRFDAAFDAPVRLDFVALGQLVGLGALGPFALLIHPQHGAWWALRAAWLVDADVDSPLDSGSPCAGCAAPCVGGWHNAGGIVAATPEVRARCVVGPASCYDEEQIAYHYDRAATLARLRST